MAGLGGGYHMTVTTGDVFRPELWSAEVLRATESALVMAPLVRRFDSLVKGKGDRINIPNVGNLSASTKTANTVVTLQYPTETSTVLIIDQHKEASFLVEDMLKVQSAYDLMSVYTEKAGYAIAKAVDTALLAEYTNFANTDVGTYGQDVTDSVVLAADEALDLADVPLEDRHFIIHPYQKTALLKLDKFVKADYMGEYGKATIVRTGPNSRFYWGDIYGTPTYYTNQVSATAATPTQYHNIYFHKECIAMAMQIAPRTQSAYILEYLGNLVVVDTIYGVKTIRDDFGVEVRS
jgi:hypothetical protein